MKKIIPIEIVNQKIREMGLKDVGKASIREIRRLVSEIELATDKKYIRMEMGIPGLDTSRIAIDAEIAALERNCSSKYPPIDGIPELKREISKLIKGFLNVDIGEKSCVPTVGSINGAYAALLVSGRIDRQKDTVLFIDPGFPVHKQLVKMLGVKEIISIEGVASPSKQTNTFYYSKKFNKKFDKINIQPLKEGIVMGVTASIILREKLPSSCIFVETHSQLPDSRGAAKIIETLDRYLGLKVDIKPLLQKAEEFEGKLKMLMEQGKLAEDMKKIKDPHQLDYLG